MNGQDADWHRRRLKKLNGRLMLSYEYVIQHAGNRTMTTKAAGLLAVINKRNKDGDEAL